MLQEPNNKAGEDGLKTEVVARTKRRQHPAEYKLRILREVYAALLDEGQHELVMKDVIHCKWGDDQRDERELNGRKWMPFKRL